MAACLAKKRYKLLVHDQNPTPARKFVQEFPACRLALAATDGRGVLGREAFRDCEIVITMLPDGKIVREALLGGEWDRSGVATWYASYLSTLHRPYICVNHQVPSVES